MRKTYAVLAILFALLARSASQADASTLSFRNFTAGSGVTVSVPYRAGAGTAYDPDTVTLAVDLAAPTLTFHITAVGSGFTGGGYCELDWDDDDERYGAPWQEDFIQTSGGGFSRAQTFSLSPARLNLAAGARTVRYELDVDEEPYGRDVERHLSVTFIPSGAAAPAPTPVNPAAPALAFQNFTAGSGVTVSVPYRAGAGTRYAPDTVTLAADLSAPVLRFQLTAVVSGFTGGRYCKLDWDDDDERLGAPYERIVQLSGSSLSVTQDFSLDPSRLRLTAGGAPQTVLYELEADEEPYGGREAERYLQVTFTASGSNPTNPVAPTAPAPPSGDQGSGGGGCSATGAGLAIFGCLALLRRRDR